MTTRIHIILLLCIALLAITTLSCISGGDEWRAWQEDVSERQRQPGQPGNVATVEAERTGK